MLKHLTGPQCSDDQPLVSRMTMTACCERLVGCIECNRWSWRGSNRLFMELLEEDLEALKAIKKKRPPGRSSLKPFQHLSPLAGLKPRPQDPSEGALG